MNIGLNLLTRIKSGIENYKLEKEQERLEEKQNIINSITKSWSKYEIDCYNTSLIGNTAGWIGGNFNEKDCKEWILRHNGQYFTPEEYQELYYKIYPERVLKK